MALEPSAGPRRHRAAPLCARLLRPLRGESGQASAEQAGVIVVVVLLVLVLVASKNGSSCAIRVVIKLSSDRFV